MQELDIDNFPSNLDFDYPLINAVVNKSQTGFVFQQDIDKNLFFIYHKAGFSYLSHNISTNYHDIIDFFTDSEKLPSYFHIYDANPGLINCCFEKREYINFKVRKRIRLRFQGRLDIKQFPGLRSNYAISRISINNFGRFEAFNLKLDSKFWSSESDFLKNGFGFGAFDENNVPVSVCYAACIANKVAEIDVATLPGHQKKGLARLVVTEFVSYCIENDLMANWDCFEDNLGSLKTAYNTGFTEISAYNFLSIFNKNRNAT